MKLMLNGFEPINVGVAKKLYGYEPIPLKNKTGGFWIQPILIHPFTISKMLVCYGLRNFKIKRSVWSRSV